MRGDSESRGPPGDAGWQRALCCGQASESKNQLFTIVSAVVRAVARLLSLKNQLFAIVPAKTKTPEFGHFVFEQAIFFTRLDEPL